MNARDKFIAQIKPLLDTPSARWTKEANDEGCRRAENLAKGRNVVFFIYGWRQATEGQDLKHGKTDNQTERNFRSMAYDLGIEWLKQHPRPVTTNSLGFVWTPTQEIVLRHTTGQTKYTLVLDYYGLTAFIKRLTKMPVSRFVCNDRLYNTGADLL